MSTPNNPNNPNNPHAIVAEILPHLPGWALHNYDARTWYCELVSDKGLAFIVEWANQRKTRIAFEGHRPKDVPLDLYIDPPRPGITVSASQDPLKIAHAVTRRLLPALRLYSARARESAAKDAAQKQAVLDATGRMAGVLGEIGQRSTCGRGLRVRSGPGGCYGDMTPLSSGETVDVHLRSVPVPVAVELARLLALLNAGQANTTQQEG